MRQRGHRYQHDEDTALINSKNVRLTQRSPQLAVIIFSSAVLFLIIVSCVLSRNLGGGNNDAAPSTSLPDDTMSLRGGSGEVTEKQQRRVPAIGDIHGD